MIDLQLKKNEACTLFVCLSISRLSVQDYWYDRKRKQRRHKKWTQKLFLKQIILGKNKKLSPNHRCRGNKRSALLETFATLKRKRNKQVSTIEQGLIWNYVQIYGLNISSFLLY